MDTLSVVLVHSHQQALAALEHYDITVMEEGQAGQPHCLVTCDRGITIEMVREIFPEGITLQELGPCKVIFRVDGGYRQIIDALRQESQAPLEWSNLSHVFGS